MLQIQGSDEIPADTRQVAEAAFPKGNRIMAIRDQLGLVYADEQFQDLFPGRGQPAESPARLAGQQELPESRVLGNLYARFGGGRLEKYHTSQVWQLAGRLPYHYRPKDETIST